ncbi:GTP pyrophosphokinase family protein [Ruminococcus flavefaciens]|uniref:GTP pyrophosphokinase n=1 Tax=Ruminococcus flavefaciens TaxID=1265 RepID=UPI0026F31761|nr:GTP pyrophosphokinase family protein [Ruminococcus flavefaciens]MDD7516050.1 GTP pyrophosphokinase family protein [Ruminococcus flavefaciens]MDY5690417.1 GTP pyrophosphokinase family protein [Ruminococcus flavefaciens]
MSEKDFYIEAFDNLPAIADNNESLKEKFTHVFYDFLELSHLYDSAIEVVKTYLNILDNEFSVKFQRNPIHNIESRLKSPQSIIGKLQKKDLPISTDAARKNLLDLAGIRVTCYYISDIYALVEMLSRRDDFTVIKRKDYIKNPKPSGYRSYHMILNVPVYLSTHKEYAPVEIQIRTMAMDFWASLEHQLKYKTSSDIPPEISEELKKCAERIAETDMQMQKIYMQINDME